MAHTLHRSKVPYHEGDHDHNKGRSFLCQALPSELPTSFAEGSNWRVLGYYHTVREFCPDCWIALCETIWRQVYIYNDWTFLKSLFNILPADQLHPVYEKDLVSGRWLIGTAHAE